MLTNFTVMLEETMLDTCVVVVRLRKKLKKIIYYFETMEGLDEAPVMKKKKPSFEILITNYGNDPINIPEKNAIYSSRYKLAGKPQTQKRTIQTIRVVCTLEKDRDTCRLQSVESFRTEPAARKSL